MEYAKAKAVADQLVAKLAPYCERIDIAGGIRRKKAEPHDIEIVCIPKTLTLVDWDGNPMGMGYPINEILPSVGYQEKGGDRYKKIMLPGGIYLDLFLVIPPAQWGVIYAIRTGPEDYSRWLVTARAYGGACPSFLRVKDGQVWNRGESIPVPEEMDLYRLFGLPWVEPENRCPPTGR